MDVDVRADLQRDLAEFERHVGVGTTVEWESSVAEPSETRGRSLRPLGLSGQQRTSAYFAAAQRLTISSYGIVTPFGFSLASLAFGPSGLPSHCFGSTGLFSRGPQPP